MRHFCVYGRGSGRDDSACRAISAVSAGWVEVVVCPVKPRVRRHGGEEFNSLEMLRTPQFHVLYAMMLMVGIGGLMASAQVAPMARNFKIGATAVAIVLSLNPIANGAARVFWGWVSDHMGRERTMILCSSAGDFFVSVVTVGRMGDGWFVASMALVFFTWGRSTCCFRRYWRICSGSQCGFELQYFIQHEGLGVGAGRWDCGPAF